MAIERAAVTKKGSEHDIVWAWDPCVVDPEHAGWIRKQHCKVAKKGVDVLTVQFFNTDELAALDDLARAPSMHDLSGARMLVVAINGKRSPKKVKAYLDGIYRLDPNVIQALTMYGKAGARGQDPYVVVSPKVRPLYDDLDSFPPEEDGDPDEEGEPHEGTKSDE